MNTEVFTLAEEDIHRRKIMEFHTLVTNQDSSRNPSE